MVKIDTKTSRGSNNSSQNLSFEFPASEKITIDKINLHVQLDKFKEAVINSFNLDSLFNFLVTISAVWVPVFTSDFKIIFGYSSSLIKGFYFCFAIVITFYSIYRLVIKPVQFYFLDSKASSNPEKMAQIILEKCNKK